MGGKEKGVARVESMDWIAPPEASAASLVSRYVTCKFVLRRDPPFLFCMLASVHRAFPRSVPPSLPPVHGGRPIPANTLRDSRLVNGTKLKQRSLCSRMCILISDLFKVYGLAVHLRGILTKNSDARMIKQLSLFSDVISR